ncbi:partial Leucine-, isoleucine-, valine-, threonine-, and alanine-binding protein, partial [Planctomycetaceae bacterium]
MRKLAILTGLVLGLAASRPSYNAQPAAKDPIVVGVMLPLSGAISEFGKSAHQGVLLAAEQINAAGGINGAQIKLKVIDTRSDAAKVEAAAKKLINEDKVSAAIGDVASGHTKVAALLFKDAKLPLITPCSTNDTLSEGNPWLFRACFTDKQQGEACAVFARRRLQKSKIAVVTDKESGYSKALAESLKKKAKELNGEIVAESSYVSVTDDWAPVVEALGDFSKLDLVFAPVYYADAAMLAKELRQQGYTGTILGGDGWESDEIVKLGGKALDGAYWVGHFNAASDEAKEFVSAFRKKHNAEPDSLAALGYDALMMLRKAFMDAKSTVGKEVADALAALKEFKGST